jgi:hypothetical protein
VFLDFNLLGGDVEASPAAFRSKSAREPFLLHGALSPLFFIYISSCLYAAEAGGRVDGADTYYLLLDVPITLSSSLWGGDQTLKGSQSSLEQKNTTPASLKITLSAQLPVA